MSANYESVELLETLKNLCADDYDYNVYFEKFLKLPEINDENIEEILSILAELILIPKYTSDVVKYFSKYLLQLLSLAIPTDNFDSDAYNIHLINCVLLSQICTHSDGKRFMLEYFEKRPSPFDSHHFKISTSSPSKKPRIAYSVSNYDITDLEIVTCCYNFLRCAADFFRNKWNWSDFLQKYCAHDDDRVQWISIHCIGIVTGMSEVQLNALLENYFSKEKIIEYSRKYSNIDVSQNFHLNTVEKSTCLENLAPEPKISNNVVSISGILLPVYKSGVSGIEHLVQVGSTRSNLRKVALGIAANRAVCLQGPVGSGKTALVEYLAGLTGRSLGESFCKVQLGDQTDSKMLLGTYRCTDIPGEFVWQPGVLTQGVTEGSWLLLEDIDSASMDVATVISSLLENGYLSVPGFRDTVPVTPGFQLFVTQRLISTSTGHHKKPSSASTLLEKCLQQVQIEPLTKPELIQIVSTKFPTLSTISTRIVDVFLLFSSGHSSPLSTSRHRMTSPRDLLKWCRRAILDFDITSPNSALNVLQDAIDIFCCSFASVDDRKNLSKEICARLGVIETKAEYFCDQYKPFISLRNKKIIAGRTSIAKISELEGFKSGRKKNSKFCFTRPSSCLLERIIYCVNLQEPVLLVGETGTGKTSSVQYLAEVLGQKLVVINMNQQSDSADLLGGYKPVDVKMVIRPIRLEFEVLFREYFAIEQNRKFLKHIDECFNKSRWSTLLLLMKHSQQAAVKRLQGESKQKPNLAQNNEPAQDEEQIPGQKRARKELEDVTTSKTSKKIKKTTKEQEDEPEEVETYKTSKKTKKTAKLQEDEVGKIEASEIGKKTKLQENQLGEIEARKIGKKTKKITKLQDEEVEASKTGKKIKKTVQLEEDQVGESKARKIGKKIKKLQVEEFEKVETRKIGEKTKKLQDEKLEEGEASKISKKSKKLSKKHAEDEREEEEVEPETPDRAKSGPLNRKQKELLERWTSLGLKLNKLSAQLKHQNALAFAFIEGSLIRALENGQWVLLDEINLANAETLECLSGLLEGSSGSLSLLERGDRKPVHRHKQFTLFACMNPSTDVGKKDLPPGLRNRFSEFFVEELTDRMDLVLLVRSYLEERVPKPLLESIVEFYLRMKDEANSRLSDGLGHKPHYSLRTLCRALRIAGRNLCGSVERNLYEAFCLSFLTQLDSRSYNIVEEMIGKAVIGASKLVKSVLNQPIPEPSGSDKRDKFLQVQGYWVSRGHLEPEAPKEYVLTSSVRRNLKDLVRVVAIGKLPVLLQGDTSVGKTSLITYLARTSGNKCVRINNHEHTDLQEYIGSYVADEQGKLVFREGVLVEAMRFGHWIILDELNLAPTDVLEALNRVLDDNRELFIPETQETVKAHRNFMLFATQNPPGAYGGRKILSRAFRNRFVELHFNEIPPNELEIILHQRCEMPISYCKKMVAVMTDLQLRRRVSATFAGKQGFITLRDLFRWGERYRLAQNRDDYYDWDQHLADEGFLVLAGKVRRIEERKEIAEVLKKHMKRSVLTENLFSLHEKTSPVTRKILEKIYEKSHLYPNIVWTFNTRQLAVLVGKAQEFSEPVLLVGETGGGKTTVCKLIAENNGQKLITVNCHMHTESSDFIGGLRPVREHNEQNKNRLFEWVDGPLLEAMHSGQVFLADEISLADDSVLERLNSLLEPERSLLLAEKGTDLSSPSSSSSCSLVVTAHENFHFVGTMNPGGDFGKKELSPALRNRFTEIWCESCTDRTDLIQIIEHNLKDGLSFGNQQDGSSGIGKSIMDFVEWFKNTEIGKRFTISIRDILTWVNFLNTSFPRVDISEGYIHGACLTFLDSFGSGVTGTESFASLKRFREECLDFLNRQITSLGYTARFMDPQSLEITTSKNGKYFGIDPFYVEKGRHVCPGSTFTLTAPTTLFNTLRLLRGLQLNKAILLEGSPGVGKTSLVNALAKITHHKLLRINLSDQTDICDLFGADLPVEGGRGGEFAWRDGPFLRALKNGDWILLDELNLASQSVLEGLNACLDHRGEIFIPELGKTFYVQPGTRLFASQNPLRQGGSRRGLPKSFLNRFTQVYIDSLTNSDLLQIIQAQFPQLPSTTINLMIGFNHRITSEVEGHKFGHRGAPWEFNLRDLTRWCETMMTQTQEGPFRPECSVSLIYADRMRTRDDKKRVEGIFEEIFGVEVAGNKPVAYVTKEVVYVGDAKLKRGSEKRCEINLSVRRQEETCLILRSQLPVLRSLMHCVNLNWMAILVGSSASGKSSVIRTLSQLTGCELRTLSVNSAMDTTDILGGFEQVDYNRHLEEISNKTEQILLSVVQKCLLNSTDVNLAVALMKQWEIFNNIQHDETDLVTMAEESKLFRTKLHKLSKILETLKGHNFAKSFVDQIKTLKSRLVKLKKNVDDEGSLNAGGKFEWIDSVLVKCLQDGCWLLIENVNLCSPAVLDRLNALLEPNGVLTIGERGVDENGEMVHIVPHPNFRLFLTMDPKNGEISRAMRNRGVEIYLLNDVESGFKNEYDLKALISQNGISVNEFQDILIRVHEFISELILGEKPTISHILQSSFLLSQQLLRGINITEAFTSSLLDVYFKPRSVNDFNTTDPLTEIETYIKTLLKPHLTQQLPNHFADNKTLKCMHLQTDSSLELIKQQTSSICELLRRQNFDNIYNHFLVAYTISCSTNLRLKYTYLKQLIETADLKMVNETFYSTMEEFFTRKKGGENPEMPADSLWLPDTCYTVEESSQLFLLLAFTAANLKMRPEKVSDKKMKMSIWEYSKAVFNKKISDFLIDSPLIVNFHSLISAFDIFLTNLLKNYNLKLVTPEDTIQSLILLSWRFVLQEVGSLIIHKKNKKVQIEKVLPEVIVRYKWFIKHTVGFFRKFSPKNNTSLDKVVKIINSGLESKFSNLVKISRGFKKADSNPLPLVNQDQISTLTTLELVSLNTSLIGRSPNSLPVSAKCSLVLNSPEFRKLLIEVREKVRENSLSDDAKNLTNFLNNYKEQPIELSDLQLLPVKDLFGVYLTSIFRNSIFSLGDETKNEETLNSLRKICTVAPELIETFAVFLQTRNRVYCHELERLVITYFKSAVILSPSVFLSWDKKDEESFQLRDLSIHGPNLTYAVTNICVDLSGSCDDLVTNFELGKYREKTEQLRFLNETLWQNIPGLYSNSFDFIINDVKYILKSFEDFIYQLEKSLNGSINSTSLDESTNTCIKKINEIYESAPESPQMMNSKNKLMKIFHQLHSEVQLLKNHPSTSEDTNQILHTANIYCLLNYLKAVFNSQLPVIDPLEKKVLKKFYCEEERKKCSCLKDAFEIQNEIYTGNQKTLHSFCEVLAAKIKEFEERERELSQYVAVRPSGIYYQNLVKDVSYNLNTLLSEDFLLNIFNKLNTSINLLQEAIDKKSTVKTQDAKDELNQCTNWLHSQENSSTKLLKYRPGYPDIIEPLLGNIAQLSYGVKLLSTLLKKLLVKYEFMEQNLDVFMSNLVQFPVLGESQKGISDLIELCSHSKNVKFVAKILDDESLGDSKRKIENLRMLKCAVQELYNLFVLSGPNFLGPQNKMLQYLENLNSLFVSAWYKQEMEKQKKIEEEQSIYKTVSKCETLTEEEENYRSMRLLFPNFHEKDFSDFQPLVLEDPKNPDDSEDNPELIGHVTNEDIYFISQIHTELMQIFTRNEWLNPQKKKNVEPNFIVPLLQRYKLFTFLQHQLIDGIGQKIEDKILPSLNLLVAVAQKSGEGSDLLGKSVSSPKKLRELHFDFYKDPNVDEVKSCLYIIEGLQKRILEFMIEWPEHPTLKSIQTIIERIYSFPITSSVSRFLTGLEILLSKCQEWEENAHSGVSLAEHSQNLTQQIISWRKLELAGWKDSLNYAFQRVKKSASKWWLHIYSTIVEFISGFDVKDETITENAVSTEQILKIFQEFIEKSPLGEYEIRVELLFTFHCYTLYLPKSEKRDIVVSLLWNLYKYYGQFTTNVNTRIKTLRSPIEKKLKDFVKIARWNDINYWAVKTAVEKTHRTLHKYVKEFENILKQGVTDCLVNVNTQDSNSEQVGIWDRPTRHTPSQYHYSLDASNYMASVKFKKLFSDQSISSESSDQWLNKIEKYFSKSRNLCKDIITKTDYPNLIQNLDTFVAEVIETSNHLRNLEVNKEHNKEKQKSQAKSILQQKRKALADLFKNLTKCGLSHRTGLVESKLRKDSISGLLLKPIDLSAAFSQLKNKGACDGQLLTIWDGCETYFLRTIARLAALDAALKTPSKDLGLQNIERCKGFSVHLMVLAQQQKQNLIESSRILYYLRNYIQQISEWGEVSTLLKRETVDSIKKILINIIIVMKQLEAVLFSCPEPLNFQSQLIEVPVLNSENEMKIKYRQTPEWNTCVLEVKSISSCAQKLKKVLEKLDPEFPAVDLNQKSSNYLFIADKSVVTSGLDSLLDQICKLKTSIGDNSLTSSISWLLKELQIVAGVIREENFRTGNAESSDGHSAVVNTGIKKLVDSILVIIQKIYKKYKSKSGEKSSEEADQKIQKDQHTPENQEGSQEVQDKTETFEDNHLKKLIVEDLFHDISLLEMKTLFKKLKKLMDLLFRMDKVEEVNSSRMLLWHCVPILEQMVLLYQYFVTQQVSAYRVTCKISSVLLNIFVDLASKGFCIPEEFAEELSSEGETKQTGGMGLGDGEGEKDVSDRIESEDQLEDAQPEGQEKKDDDKDCKEEEKGIEMSEDFEGKLQDVEKPEDEDESQSDSDSDAEKQMGETETDADQLDQQIWGSDDEEDPEQEQEKQDNKEERGEGGELEDQQMAAKEDGAEGHEENEDEDHQDKRKEPQKEINEMDEPEFDEDQTDPYHGNQPPLPEPEPMDLPDDLQLDDGEGKEEEDKNEENPFDIDIMKDQMPPKEDEENEKPENLPGTEDKQEENSDSSDEEETNLPEAEKDAEAKDGENEDEGKENENESGGLQPEKQEDEQDENKETENKEDTSALDNQPSKEEEIQAMDAENTEAADNVQTNPNIDSKTQKSEQISQEENEDKAGVGQAQMEDSETGHRGEVNAPKDSVNAQQNKEVLPAKRQRPGESDSNRTLGETAEPIQKKLKTFDTHNEDKAEVEEEADENAAEKNPDMYQHIKEAKQTDTQVMDAATEEQASLQKVQKPENEDEKIQEEPTEEPTEMMDDEPEPEMNDDVPKQKSEKNEKSENSDKKKSGGTKQEDAGEMTEEIKDVEVEGEIVETMKVSRGNESSYHTQYEYLDELMKNQERLSVQQIQELRTELENQLGTWIEPPVSAEASQTWEKFTSLTSQLARDLCEQLRLVLEPTQSSRLRGDFRTGRRINMRKIIPYIASEFRRDKIWMRRTAPSKRRYQIALAIDDSASMDDNHSKELAFESVALISQALTFLEAGQLAVLRFGETTTLLHQFSSDAFAEGTGRKMLQEFQFQQKKTCVAKLVDFATVMFGEEQDQVQVQVQARGPNAKLLVIVSDGRGIFSEGETVVQQAVRRAKFADIFMVFVIIDNPRNENSILDIRMPLFKDGKLMGIQSYLDNFPFPFYVILRDINALPSVLSDALRQWFELVTSVDK